MLTADRPWKDGIVGKHLLDETAEFAMPRSGRHAAEDDVATGGDHLEATQRFDPGFRSRPAPSAGSPQSLRTR
jgi:hypothetical protein